MSPSVRFKLYGSSTGVLLLVLVIITCITQLAASTSTPKSPPPPKSTIELDVEFTMNHFGQTCTDILKKHVSEKQLHHKRTGFINFPALRQKPEEVKTCTLSLLGTIQVPTREEQVEKVCNSIRRCAHIYDTSSANKLGVRSSFNVLAQSVLTTIAITIMFSSLLT